MKCYIKTYRILVIFLLLGFVMPVGSLLAQSGYMSIEEIEKGSDESTSNGAPYLVEKGNPVSVPDNDYQSPPNGLINNPPFDVNLAQKRNVFTSESGNYINLTMNGIDNSIETMQHGKKNIMELEIDADHSTGNVYHQIGNNNYIADKISEDGVHHEYYQEGNNLAVQNRGMQTIPMVTNQRGYGMQLRITSSPPRQ